MKKLYIMVVIGFLLSIVLFIASFVYLDKSKHRTYYYEMSLDDHYAGSIKIDRFETEDKIIYKAYSNVPFAPGLAEAKTKIELDPKYNFQDYVNERYDNGIAELFLLENKKNGMEFLAKSRSGFMSLDGTPVKNNTFIFAEDSPVTYLPIIENYNFRKGRAQGFNSLVISSPMLPPMKKLITLTSIKDEYLKVDSRNIKTENLLLKIKNYPQGTMWVAKSDKSLMKLEIPQAKLKITRTFTPKAMNPQPLDLGAGAYVSQEVVFSNKNVRLAGAMTFPKNGSPPFPAVLLVAPAGPEDRDYYGFFTYIADYLTKNGFCVLRFDKRGVGKSSGDAFSHTFNDELEDLATALDYLTSAKEVDPKRIALLSHSNGAIHALKLAAQKDIIRTVILTAPSLSLDCGDEGMIERLKNAAVRYMWSEDYLKLVLKSVEETREKVEKARHGWTFVSGKICFVKNLKEEMAEKPNDLVKIAKPPVLILQGKNDEDCLPETAPFIDKSLGDSGNQDHLVRYYSYLGHFLGKTVNDGLHKVHYEADAEVLGNMKSWLEAHTAAPAAPTQISSVVEGQK